MKIPWAVAAVAIACIAAIVALSALHADSGAMLGVLLTVIGGLTVSTHQQTNGNTSKLIELITNQSQQLARTMPPLGTTTPEVPPAPPPTEGTGT